MLGQEMRIGRGQVEAVLDGAYGPSGWEGRCQSKNITELFLELTFSVDFLKFF